MMAEVKFFTIKYTLVIVVAFMFFGCSNAASEEAKLMQTIEDYENAWALGDFLKVES